MSHIALIVLCAAGVLLFIFALMTFLILGGKEKTPKKAEEAVVSKKKFSTDLEKMIAKAADTSLNDSDLKKLATLFIATHKLGSKTSKDLDEATKKKLEFVSSFASNASASATNVSFLNRELKKLSNSYKKEIDAYEQMGLAKRKIKES
ncbi:hypothetical protein CVU5213_02785 [Campylobacter vulpis]|uniref:Membrane protein n=1 Tax=Campylobacter vulpis TaxID=1655500 RepID=A0A2G4R7H0_9BACT|nr:hypothetical protein [Campylobacter vulpis]MBS4240664.1 hypothetical protein [Campylobacter vulpis]MBS4252052.1 hypothetical protein [Campylobacter vulpis]MBS4281342.1 hypothetical protein [Campylobacter vulpis]MBS4330804.1 hypothetical protein [Campylobacter vulpis]MBS4438981.1 hypothetical protein [Campylobacter vulpis]